ncbi:B12-binding domain-containing radical SAM protein [bacterium]|nr:B12-binding domain-containing radical SAM protein [candidate division CSSED10-310 bacterium]
MARVLFLQRIWTENLGPMYLSAAAKNAGHTCSLLIEDGKPDDQAIRALDPDVIAFSVTTGSHHWAIQRAAQLKHWFSGRIIMGGPHATFFPEVIENKPLDVIFRGECEQAFVQYLNGNCTHPPSDHIPNIWYKKDGSVHRHDLAPLETNLDAIPFPDRQLYYDTYPYFRNNENKPFISGRGCPYSCSYCSISSLRNLYSGKGPFVRFHSPERVIEEITEVRDRYGLRSVIFQDDTFILGQDRLEKLLDLYGQYVRLPFICHIRADLLTRDIAQRLRSAGCHSVDFGVESGDEALRAIILGKPISDDQLFSAAGYLHEAGIRFRTTNMFGLPGETFEQALKTISLNQTLKTDFPSSSIYQPYPRTELGDRVIEAGLAGANYTVDSIGSTFFRTSLLQGRDRRRFINLQKFFWLGVRYPALMPIIKMLIKARPNFIFEGIFLTCYAINYALSEKVTLRHVFNIGRRTAKTVFFGKL